MFCGAIFLLLLVNTLFAQKHTIRGYISDKDNGEKLIGATVYDMKSKSVLIANEYGFYSITLNEDTVKLVFSFVGYTNQIHGFYFSNDTLLNINLSSSIQLKEIEIVESKNESIQENNQMGSIHVASKFIQTLPAICGDKDILRAIQLLPGVKSGVEGTTGFYVRGGGQDQNLILLDGVPVYNPSHFSGFFSVFIPEAINNIELIKGGFPARYGGRLSSVLDIHMKEGNLQQFKADGTIGLIASKLTLEGPIIKNKSSFIVSARRTYFDLLVQPIIKSINNYTFGQEMKFGYYFNDVNAKINYQFSPNNKLYLSFYSGKDDIYTHLIYTSAIENNARTINYVFDDWGWGNTTAALRWNWVITPKLFSNTTLTYSHYKYFTSKTNQLNIETWQGERDSSSYIEKFFSGIDDLGAKIDFDYFPHPKHRIKFGAGEIYHTFTPGTNSIQRFTETVDFDSAFGSALVYANEISAYIEDEIRFNSRFSVNIGTHASTFLVDDTSYYSVQPRISARYLFNELWSLKASFVTMAQYIHLLTTSGISLPSDLWVPVTSKILPQTSLQGSIGVAHTLKKEYEISVEAYYKTMENLLEYKEGISYQNLGESWENKVESGRGWSYGSEFLIQKNEGKLNGWIGYTLSWTYRQFENLNQGEKFPFKYDRRHDIGVALNYKYNDKIDGGLIWVFSTGNAVTIAQQDYLVLDNGDTSYSTYYGDRNSFRMPINHRLDIAVNFHKEKKYGTRSWGFGIYNVYSRLNPLYLSWEEDDDGELKLYKYGFLPIMPFVSYTFKFLK
jgi:outer membrane receptor for ferrienterochelin and colicin